LGGKDFGSENEILTLSKKEILALIENEILTLRKSENEIFCLIVILSATWILFLIVIFEWCSHSNFFSRVHVVERFR